jgi:hypothetical protein
MRHSIGSRFGNSSRSCATCGNSNSSITHEAGSVPYHTLQPAGLQYDLHGLPDACITCCTSLNLGPLPISLLHRP